MLEAASLAHLQPTYFLLSFSLSLPLLLCILFMLLRQVQVVVDKDLFCLYILLGFGYSPFYVSCSSSLCRWVLPVVCFNWCTYKSLSSVAGTRTFIWLKANTKISAILCSVIRNKMISRYGSRCRRVGLPRGQRIAWEWEWNFSTVDLDHRPNVLNTF